MSAGQRMLALPGLLGLGMPVPGVKRAGFERADGQDSDEPSVDGASLAAAFAEEATGKMIDRVIAHFNRTTTSHPSELTEVGLPGKGGTKASIARSSDLGRMFFHTMQGPFMAAGGVTRFPVSGNLRPVTVWEELENFVQTPRQEGPPGGV